MHWPKLPAGILFVLLAVLAAGCTSPEVIDTPLAVTASQPPAVRQAVTPSPLPPVSQPATAPGSERTARPDRQAKPVESPGAPEAAQEYSVILGRPTDRSIAVNILAGVDMEVILEYGLAPDGYDSAQGPFRLQAGLPVTIELTDLVPDTDYVYRFIVNGGPTVAHTFRTQRIVGSSFTFTIDADPHNRDPRFDGELYSRTLGSAHNDRPDFHINLGDTFMTEKVKPRSFVEAESTFIEMRPYLGLLASDVPLFLVNGNHEGELGWLLAGGKDQEFPVWSTQLRQKYYPNPVPNEFYRGSTQTDPALGERRDGYYAWTWGDVLFVVLDPFWYTEPKPKAGEEDTGWNWTLGQQQYDWLRSTLESSQSRYKFVFLHHLVGGNPEGRGGIEFAGLYEWGGKNPDGTDGFGEHRPGWEAPIHSLLVQNGVDAVFHGHDHIFVRQELDGIIYQEVPQSSNPQPDNTRLAQEYGYVHGDVVAGSGYLRVTVSPAGASVDFIRIPLSKNADQAPGSGQAAFSYVIQ